MEVFLQALRDSESALNQYVRETWCSGDASPHEQHEIERPATEADLERLRQLGGESLVPLYEKCNGLRLCAPDASQGILIYSVGNLASGNAAWKAWLTDLEEDELWDFQKFGLAFGEIAESGNYGKDR